MGDHLINEGRGREVTPSPAFVCPNKDRPDLISSCRFCDKGRAFHPTCPHAPATLPQLGEDDGRD